MQTIEITSQGTCLVDQLSYPAVGFGTYPLKAESCYAAVSAAAELGYRIIDTATFYGNFDPIRRALQPWGRENFYLISKVWPDSHTFDRLHRDLEMTLEKLQTSYLDAYLLHWPNSQVPLNETFSALEALMQKKVIRHIGLSNVTPNHLKKALELDIPISWVQVEMHPHFYDRELLNFCDAHAIAVQAWSPLGRGRVGSDAVLLKLGRQYGKTAAQIALRWIIQHGCLPLPSSKNAQHMRQNREIVDFALSQDEMRTIDVTAKAGERRRITPDDGLGFVDEFDFSYEKCWPK